MESLSSCTEEHYCYKTIEPISTTKEIRRCQHPICASLNALEKRTAQAAVLTIVLLKGIPVSEYREQLRGNIREEVEKKTSFFFATVRKTWPSIREECFFPRMERKEKKSLQNIFPLDLVCPEYLNSSFTTCSSYYDWALWSFDINNLSTIKSKFYGTYSWLKEDYRVYHEKWVLDNLIWISNISQTISKMYHTAPLLLCYLVFG